MVQTKRIAYAYMTYLSCNGDGRSKNPALQADLAANPPTLIRITTSKY